MDAIPAATDEELEAWPNYMCTFHQWMQRNGRKEQTARAYVRQMCVLFEDDGKGPASMATQEYFQITKASIKNKTGNGQRSASVRAFMEFWTDHNGGPLEDAAGAKIYQVKGRPTQTRSEQMADRMRGESNESEEALALRAELGLPDVGWSIHMRTRKDGDQTYAVSPNGTAYKTREAVQARLAQENLQGSAPSAPSSTPAPPGPRSTGSRAKLKSAGEDSPVAASTAEAGGGSPATARPAAGSQELVRRTIPLREALQRFNKGKMGHQVLLCSGRDPNARLAQRIHGLYLQQDERSNGRPVFRKVDEEKATLVFFNEAKGLWRMTETLETKGDFAKVKDEARAPWEISRPWRVFNGETYEEDPKLSLALLDPSAVHAGVEVEVCAALDDLETPASASTAPGEKGSPPPKKPKLEAKESKKDLPSNSRRKSKEGEEHEDGKAAEEESGPARQTIALAEALRRFDPGGDREAVLVSGRDASAKNANRINGLYFREVNASSVWTKVGCQSKVAAIFFNPAKGQWQISKGLEASGNYAHAKDKAEHPWEVKKTWKAFNGESYDEDPGLRVSLIDRGSVPDFQVEVDAPSSSSAKPAREPSTGSLLQTSQISHLLPEDAPEDHIVHSKLKFEPGTKRVTFQWPAPDGRKIQFQTTLGLAGSREVAEVIARACYLKFDEGWSKEQVTQFRKECYDRIKSGSVSNASLGETSAAGEEDPDRHKKRRLEKEENGDGPRNGDHAKAAKKQSSDAAPTQDAEAAPAGEASSQAAEKPPPKAPEEAAEDPSAAGEKGGGEGKQADRRAARQPSGQTAAKEPEAPAAPPGKKEAPAEVAEASSPRPRWRSRSLGSPEPGQAAGEADQAEANSDDDSSSSSSSSASDAEEAKNRQSPQEVEQVVCLKREPLRPAGPLGRLGRRAAKMSVRTGLRCWCCYETVCRRAKSQR